MPAAGQGGVPGPGLHARLRLTSANSINIGRLLPQCMYYVYAGTRSEARGGEGPTVCVPSGNFGNLTARRLRMALGPSRPGLHRSHKRQRRRARNTSRAADSIRGRPDRPSPTPWTLATRATSSVSRRSSAGDWQGMASRIEGSAVNDESTMATMRQDQRRARHPGRSPHRGGLRRCTGSPRDARRVNGGAGHRAIHCAPGKVLRHRERGHGHRPGDARTAGAAVCPAKSAHTASARLSPSCPSFLLDTFG